MSNWRDRRTAGTAYFQWDTITYFGDGTNTTVLIPEGAVFVSVDPPYPYKMHLGNVLEFTKGKSSRAIPFGYKVEIIIKDAMHERRTF